MKQIASTLLIAFTLLVSFQSFILAQEPQNDTPKGMVIKVHADWCGACKVIEPSFQALKSTFEGKGAEFLVFDRTNRQTKKKAEELAKDKVFAKIYTKKNKTGIILVVDAETKKVLKVFRTKNTLEEMGRYIQQRLSTT